MVAHTVPRGTGCWEYEKLPFESLTQMAHRWKGIVNLNSRGDRSGKFRVLASLTCSSTGALLVPTRNALFFVGDQVKDSGNPIVERLSQLENIAAALIPKVGPNVNVWVVEPSHHMGPFACYENILPNMTATGEPLGYKPKGLPAARACFSILHDCLHQVKVGKLVSTEKVVQGKDDFNPEESGKNASPFEPFLDPIRASPSTILFGFSKGGVVLNQLLSEIVHFEESLSTNDLKKARNPDKRLSSPMLLPSTVEAFLNSVEEVHYIDVGLNCQGAYQTDPRVLEGLAKAARLREQKGFYVGIHGTPRQWQDRNRRWIAIEKDRCVKLLEEAALKYGDGKMHVKERLYFDGKPSDLQMHFQIIECLVLR